MRRQRRSIVDPWWLLWLALVVLGVQTASADIDLADAALTGTSVGEQSVTTTLTVRGAPGPIDEESLSVRLGGDETTFAVSPAASVPRTTMLVIDTSGSMGAQGMAVVREAVRGFLDELPDDVQVGVVSFADTAGVDLAPTLDREAVLEWVDGLNSDGYTALYQGVQTAVDALGTEGERSIILLSDGGDTVTARDGGPGADAEARAATVAAVREGGVRVEVVAFKESDEARDDVVADLAAAGGGSVADASDGAAVTAAFEAAAQAFSSQLVLTVDRPEGASGSQSLGVDGVAGGVPFTAQSTVDLGAAGSAPPPGTASPTPPALETAGTTGGAGGVSRGPLGISLLLLAAAGIFLGTFVLVMALLSPGLRSRKSERLEAIEQFRAGVVATRATSRAQATSVTEQLVGAGDRLMAGRRHTSRTMALIERADLPLRAGEWLLVRIISVVIVASLGYLVLSGRSGLLGLVVGAVIGLVLPSVVLRVMAARRARRFEQTLPDVMMLVATSLSSGFSLLQALDAVAKDAPAPADKEFSRALAQARIGADVADALDTVATRMDSENLRWATMAIRIQREVGGNLAETLRTTAATLREREYLKRHVSALSAEGRLSAYVLIALPLGLMAYMTMVNYEYVSLLWTRALGILMLVVAFILLIIGIFWMRKVVQIEV
ncbi:VWA domain-containing protein [Nostocoides sp. F2B08]|uniref:type II secretion system F family protein n=1 Tax=Nostocoides sp. F2B08 TaxID=2653936 RepID=UPI001262AD1B|nr:type II secretion system F family protein [Tetrasphaera sp. F2B08]KAB7741867.1 VWA domain-containing protein [Tetrasphaera sp. F2B08]